MLPDYEFFTRMISESVLKETQLKMKLSKNFALWEFCKSQIADRNGIINFPSPPRIDNLKALCQNVLQIIRNHYQLSVRVNSGFRGDELEKIIARNGYLRWCERQKYEVNSESWRQYFERKSHPKGEAADIEIPGIDNKELFDWIKASDIKYDQLILEYYEKGKPSSGWIHISFREGNNRMQAFTRG